MDNPVVTPGAVIDWSPPRVDFASGGGGGGGGGGGSFVNPSIVNGNLLGKYPLTTRLL